MKVTKTLKIEKDFRDRLGDAQQYLRQIVAQMDQGYTSGEGWSFEESDSLPKESDITLPSDQTGKDSNATGAEGGEKPQDEAKADQVTNPPQNAPQEATEASKPAPEGGKRPWWDRD